MLAEPDPQYLADVICAALDPLMTAHGFQTGQSGVGAEIGIIYCSQHVEFRRRFPTLAPTIQYDDEGACTDLNVYASSGPHARLHDIRFDGVTLEEVLAGDGIEFADEARTIASLPAQEGAIRLRSVLDKLFAIHAAA